MGLTLYVKAGTQNLLGECPFCHRIRMIAMLKNLNPELVFVDVSNKPESFLKLGGTTVPVLQDGDVVLKDSNSIAQYLDDKYPPSLDCNDESSKSAGSAIFGKFAAFIKNKDPMLDNDLRKNLLVELKQLDDFLNSRPYPFLSGDTLTLPDCSILPKLYHVQVATKYFKNLSIPKDFTKLHLYLKVGFASDAFQKTLYPETEVIYGWKKHM